MALVNEHFLKLPGSYLFSDIAKKVNTFKITHPKQDVIRLGIGDVTRPLPPVCIEAMHKAVDEMASEKTFRGYGPEQGYDFLIEAILKNDFAPRGVHLSPSEIFINDGAKSDTGNIGELLRWDNSMGITDPVYPVADEPEHWRKAEHGATSLTCPAQKRTALCPNCPNTVWTSSICAIQTTPPVPP